MTPRRHVSPPPPAVGFFGKIPSRGDFVGQGLPRGLVEALDAWMAGTLAGSRALLGDAWLDAWLEAPVWRFALPPRLCGADAVLGAWMPSVDRVGRYYPLVLAAVLPGGSPEALRQGGGAWLAGAVAAGFAALEEDLAPETLAARLAGLAPPAPGPAAGAGGDASLWWTDGAPLVPAAEFRLPGLPDAACLARMIRADPAPTLQAAERCGS